MGIEDHASPRVGAQVGDARKRSGHLPVGIPRPHPFACRAKRSGLPGSISDGQRTASRGGMTVRRRTLRLCAISVAVAMLVGGCQNMNDTQRTQMEGAGGGVVAGAIIGAIFGGARGAALGAALGGTLGLGVGSVVAERKRHYADAENFYEAQIQLTQAKNSQLAQYNRDLSDRIAEYRHEIAVLQNQVRAGNADQLAASRTNAQIQATYAESKKMLDDAKRELSTQQEVAQELRRSKGEQASRTAQENEQVAALSSHIDALQQQVDTMASQSNQLQQFR
jgi:uncharacterized protein HemX